MYNFRGFTLIELLVVLAIIAILAGILTPIVTNYVDQARLTRAQADAKAVANAVSIYQRDTGQWPVYASAADFLTDTCCGGGGKTLIAGGNGLVPANGAATWNVSSVLSSTSLETYLNANLTNVATSIIFPRKGFRGPYITSLDSDPWGHAYILTAAALSGTTNHAYLISAGPNDVLDTTMNQGQTASFTVGGDDIVSLIR